MLAVAVLPACSSDFVNPNCADSGEEYWGYAAVIRLSDSEGRPATLGTTVRLTGSGIDESVTGRLAEDSIIAIGYEAGRFTLQITRGWWQSLTIENVNVPAPELCGSLMPTFHNVVLHLQPNAPPIRQVVAELDTIRVWSDPPYAGANTNSSGETELVAFIEGDAGVSAAVEWTSLDPVAAIVTPSGTLTVPCRIAAIETQLRVRSKVDPSVSALVPLTVEGTTLLECPENSS